MYRDVVCIQGVAESQGVGQDSGRYKRPASMVSAAFAFFSRSSSPFFSQLDMIICSKQAHFRTHGNASTIRSVRPQRKYLSEHDAIPK